MASVSVVEELPASVDEVWALIEDFGDLSAWAPNFTVDKVTGRGKGAVRVLRAPGMDVIKEQCETHDPANHTFSYSILESGIPLVDYLATVTLTAIDESHCRIEWECTFEPKGMSEDDGVELIEGMYRDQFIATLRNTLRNRT